MSRVEQWNVVKSPRFLWHRFLLTWNVIGRRPSAAIWKRRLLQSNATGDVKYFQFEWFYPSPTITQSRQEFDKYWQPYLDLGRGISYACAFSLLFPTYDVQNWTKRTEGVPCALTFAQVFHLPPHLLSHLRRPANMQVPFPHVTSTPRFLTLVQGLME